MPPYPAKAPIHFLLLSAVVLASAVSAASDEGPRLVEDINATFHFSASSSPSFVTECAGVGFFAAEDGFNGRELWRTDGTASGTMLVKDIVTGSGSSMTTSNPIVCVNRIAYFTAMTGPTGHAQLWRSDGSPAGTYLVKDVMPTTWSSSISDLTAVGDELAFVVDRTNTGRELWKSDGTPEGTIIVKDISPGAASSDPRELTLVDGTLFFVARPIETGPELWKSDLTEAGTMLVKDIVPGGGSSYPANLTAVSGMLFFTASEPSTGFELWKSDGTADGTVMVKDINEGPASTSIGSPWIGGMSAVGGMLFFSAARPETGSELWVSDGTDEGTRLVSDIAPGPFSSSPADIVDFNGHAWFSAITPSGGRDIWMSDGTAQGTARIADLPSYTDASLGGSAAFGDALYFRLNGALWKSDGATEGTALVKDLSPGEFWDITARVGGTLFLIGETPANGRELWSTDGTSDGTSLFVDLNTGAGSSGASPLGAIGNTLYFAASDGVSPLSGLWRTDGSDSGTTRLLDIPRFASSNRPFASGFVRIGTTFFFTMASPDTGMELWKVDHLTGAVTLVKDINPGPASSSPFFLTAVNGALYFSAFRPDTGNELWTSDGTEAGTRLVRDVWPGPGDGVGWSSRGAPGRTGFMVAVNGTIFFTGVQPGTGRELWKTDGTEAGTTLVRDINPGPADAFRGRSVGDEPAVVVGDTLFFRPLHPSFGFELWKSDGTEAGTVLVKDIVPGPGGSNAFPEASLGGFLFFAASAPATGEELWRTDGTDAGTFVQEVVPGPGSAVFINSLPKAGDGTLIVAADRVVFAADDGVHGIEPWASDGFTTHLVGDINPGPASSLCCGDRFPFSPLLGTASGLAIMSADDGVDGFETWATDGQTARLIGDIAAGVPSSFPGVTMAAGRNVFFQANDNKVGAELWAITRSGLRRLFNLGD